MDWWWSDQEGENTDHEIQATNNWYRKLKERTGFLISKKFQESELTSIVEKYPPQLSSLELGENESTKGYFWLE